MAVNWTNEQIDVVLERLLPLENQGAYELALKELADMFGCGEVNWQLGAAKVRTGRPVERLLWGLCLRVRGYVGPAYTTALPNAAPRTNRSRRSGTFTWVERKMLRWVVTGESDQQKAKPTPEYMATLLQRNVEEVEQEMNRLGPARGRQGFFT